jgi:hypothetical protein
VCETAPAVKCRHHEGQLSPIGLVLVVRNVEREEEAIKAASEGGRVSERDR